MFESILIANRGEIACRVIATCKRLGIRSVAVYSDADREAPFVQLADRAIAIGRSEPAQSYLRSERILEAAELADVQAIHPGYGFLSENAAFAEACSERGIKFIGPPARAIRAMGLKDAAKELMERAGVRVVPGFRGARQDLAHLASAAAAIGYPVLIKAVAGGGGKGMRRVDQPRDFARQLESAQREAQTAFGDARVLLEKYLTRPRHIEVQVFADQHGNVVHLFERDCSLQRRHQKVLEEAPAPHASEAFRQAAYELAVRATRAVSYEGAGTIELIADVSGGLHESQVYFMEMNTRLQVEHPVTELITGLDLVEWQIRVASGEPLPCTQEQIARAGHAIEVRLYAEDPARDYMPQTGKLEYLALPRTGPHVRVDSGFVEGDTVSVFYDALLAKLIVWDVDRASAVRRLRAALREVQVAGVITNVALLGAIAAHPAFAAGDVHTGFLGEHAAGLQTRTYLHEEQLWTLVCAGRLEARRERAARDPSPWSDTRAFRINEPRRDVLSFAHEGAQLNIPVQFGAGETTLQLPSREVRLRNERLVGHELCCELDQLELRGLYVERAGRCFVFLGGHALEVSFWPSPLELEDEAALSNVLKAPMPGKVHAILVAPGDRVLRGQPLVSLEAMKMEHTLRAPRDGVVRELHGKLGEQVGEGQTLLVLSAGEES
ncbi:MAG: D-ala D-ala ligase family protein [Myxococcaceae bacterium]|nr:D-ala D-ala ligase family protein [Myxococcaceae bacterium]